MQPNAVSNYSSQTSQIYHVRNDMFWTVLMDCRAEATMLGKKLAYYVCQSKTFGCRVTRLLSDSNGFRKIPHRNTLSFLMNCKFVTLCVRHLSSYLISLTGRVRFGYGCCHWQQHWRSIYLIRTEFGFSIISFDQPTPKTLTILNSPLIYFRPDTSKGNESDCLHAPWSFALVPLKYSSKNLQFLPLPRKKALVPLPFQKRTIQAWL